jgi:uncharacterized protein YraI
MLVGVSVVSVAPATAVTVSPAINCIQHPRTNANQPSRFTGNGVNIRTGPSTSCTSIGQGFLNQSVTVHCIKGTLPNAWVYLKDNVSGVTGWSYAPNVSLIGGAEQC